MTKNSRKPRAQVHQVRIVRRPLTAEEKAYLEKARAEVEAKKDEYIARARKYQAEDEAAEAAAEAASYAPLGLSDVFRLLRAERERQGLTLADVQERSGIVKSQLCNLETAADTNPTVGTIRRVAEALGCDIAVQLVPRRDAAS